MAIDYKKVALDDLRTHPRRVESLQNLRERTVALKAQFEGIKVQNTNATPVQGGACRVEDRLVNNIVERERLKLNYRAVKPMVDIVERGLSALSGEQRTILTQFASAGRHDKGVADRLANELHMDRSTVYRLRDDALYKFTVSCYGIIDL